MFSPYGADTSALPAVPPAHDCPVSAPTLDSVIQELSEAEWRAHQARHTARASALIAGHRERRAAGERHPVEDFLFTYYSYSPSRLSRWDPGVGTLLTGDAAQEFLAYGYYARQSSAQAQAQANMNPSGERSGTTPDTSGVGVDVVALRTDRGRTVDFVSRLLRATHAQSPFLGCFGLHEWAMVYRSSPEEVRHAQVPLRLGYTETDRVVETHRIRCSHFDAFRFFTEEARPRNEHQPTRDTQVGLDQPGCLHANMDLYKWAYKLAPATPSELVLDCFELARDVRALDMRASPYDLRAFGYEPVAIETVDGKAQYVAAQREFAERASTLRSRLLAVCTALNATDVNSMPEKRMTQEVTS